MHRITAPKWLGVIAFVPGRNRGTTHLEIISLSEDDSAHRALRLAIGFLEKSGFPKPRALAPGRGFGGSGRGR